MSEALRYRPGAEPEWYNVGDFLLTHSKAPLGKLIRFAQGNSLYGVKPAYAWWNHVAVVAAEDGTLLEALLPGIARGHINDYAGSDYYLVRLEISQPDREQVREFLWSAYEARTRYGVATIASISLTLLTGSSFIFGKAGTAICSGYCAEALCRAGYIWPKPPSHMMPGDLAQVFNIPGGG